MPLRGTTNNGNVFAFFVFFAAKHFQVSVTPNRAGTRGSVHISRRT